MESPDFSPHHADASRPSLGFPLGTALLLIIIFSLSGIFSCCYHWEKLRSLRRSVSDGPDPEADIEASPSKSKPPHGVINFFTYDVTCVYYVCHGTSANVGMLFFKDLKQNQNQSLPVLMPGDEIPKFIALPCPCEPPRAEKVVVKMETPPPKPPRLPVPLY